MWVCRSLTKSDQIDGPFGRAEVGKGRKKNSCGKKLMPQPGNEPLPFACEENALTTTGK